MAKKLSTQVLDLIDSLTEDMPRKEKENLGRAIGSLLGTIANREYQSLTEEGRRDWDKKRVMHHGDFGVFVEDYGSKKRNPLVKGLGVGLQDSDRGDEDRWMYSKYLVQKPMKKQQRMKKV